MAAAGGASASTQNQALSALLFLYEIVLGQRAPWMHLLVRAQRPVRFPLVLSRREVEALLAELHGVSWLMASISARRCRCLPIRWREFSMIRTTLKSSLRELIVGYSTKPRLLVVGFTERSGRVSLIHARRATKAERKRHEEIVKPK